MSYLLFFYSNTLISISPSSLVTSVLRFGPYLHMIILVPTKHSCTRSYKNRFDFPPLAVRSLSPSESVFSPLSELSAFRDLVETTPLSFSCRPYHSTAFLVVPRRSEASVSDPSVPESFRLHISTFLTPEAHSLTLHDLGVTRTCPAGGGPSHCT